tara:strand:+ start:329 stop:571 length:243 start_codon:yes stop_codon:yes gene_type:complete
MAKVKDKELTKVEVSDNGEVEAPLEIRADDIDKQIESITAQLNDAASKELQYADLKKRCLGALEVLNNLKNPQKPAPDAD